MTHYNEWVIILLKIIMYALTKGAVIITTLYEKVKNNILNEIISNMNIGEILPTENELEQRYKVSRITIRRAIEILQEQGYVTKKQGIGTIINETKITQDANTIFSWTEEMARKQKYTKTTYIDIQSIQPSKDLIEDLKIKKSDSIYRMTRVRTRDDIPIVIMVNYLNKKYIPKLDNNSLKQGSLYGYLEETYGIYLEKAEEIITAREATPVEASLLNIKEGAALLHVRRKSFDNNRNPIEVVDMVVRGDKYQYFVEIEGRDRQIVKGM